jgi:CO dehydrogenase maturation factor
MHVGTYDEDGIGTSCYHTSLAVLENVLSHADTADDEWIVTDMVAGTDAFAGALYLMFDVIFIVVEPTPESIGVYQQFAKLADTGGVAERVVVVGNKVIDEDDKAYIKAATGDQLVGMIAHSDTLRKQRQKGAPIDTIDEGTEVFMQQIMQQARTQQLNKNEQLKRLHELHRHFASQPFTIKKYGDLTGQIDESFKFADGAPR